MKWNMDDDYDMLTFELILQYSGAVVAGQRAVRPPHLQQRAHGAPRTRRVGAPWRHQGHCSATKCSSDSLSSTVV